MRRRRLSALGAVLVLTLTAGACDWYQPGFDATNDGNNPTETVASPADLAGLHLGWEHTVPGTAAPVLVTAHGRVVGASGNTITALDLATGALDWSVAAPDDRTVVDPTDVCTGGAVPTGTFGPVAVGGVVTGLTVDCVYGAQVTPHWIGTLDLASGAVTWAFAGYSYGSPGAAGVTVSQTVVGSTRYTTATLFDRGDSVAVPARRVDRLRLPVAPHRTPGVRHQPGLRRDRSRPARHRPPDHRLHAALVRRPHLRPTRPPRRSAAPACSSPTGRI